MNKKMKTAQEYIDQEFPKGKTKYRGQALVLSVLSNLEGREQKEKELIEILKLCPTCNGTHGEWIKKEEIINKLKGKDKARTKA